MNLSANELIDITKHPLVTKESLVQRNQRIEVIVDTLDYLVSNKVGLDGMKALITELNDTIENS